jgi:hypothetical protein
MSRNEVVQSISEYNKYGKAIRRNQSLQDVAMKLAQIAELAEEAVLSEADDWFDAHTLKRNMKEIKGYSSEFQKLAEEADMTEQRMSALYEDMGRVLERYFEIGAAEDDAPDAGMMQDKEQELSREPDAGMVREAEGVDLVAPENPATQNTAASDQMVLRAIKAVHKHLKQTDPALATRFAALPPAKMKAAVWKLVC